MLPPETTKNIMRKCMPIGKKYLLLFIFYSLMTAICAQQVTTSVKRDIVANKVQISTHLKDIPVDGRIRFQQVLPNNATIAETHFENFLWDTSHSMLTILSENCQPIEDKCFNYTLSFTADINSLSMGPSAVMYEQKDGQVNKITTAAHTFYLNNSDCHIVVGQTDTVQVVDKQGYYLQISASTARQSINALSKQVHLQNGDIIVEQKSGKYYRYRIGVFATQEQLAEKLTYYRQYVPDAFVPRDSWQ